MRGPILCFVGPPGVGKTSLGQSIARAMNRRFVRISLGGVRDEAEIRGHRRTYIGAIPGRIVQALKQAGAMNPVFMLDEIDKVTSGGFQGDPASALLEVLDPAQNHSFRDHYLEVNIDLSRVLFIATANQLGTIHPALLDRMEIISLAGYTSDEKLHIARRYLVPRQLDENGLTAGAVAIEDDAIARTIAQYTREAGVRNLERQIGAVARKIAARIAGATDGSPAATPVVVTAANLPDYLGPPKVHDEVTFRVSRPGVATGVAWTEAGGDVLFIEASLLPAGHGNIILTGQLGNVMQESIRAWCRSTACRSTRRNPPGRRRASMRISTGVSPKKRSSLTACRRMSSSATHRRWHSRPPPGPECRQWRSATSRGTGSTACIPRSTGWRPA
ncbi:MAG: hypothetical protein DMF96_29310 [Acidobacteria bacterium]|nr:MAG: hypothetical protein DMF96_29310 [Acidobacteriota bacterium]